MFLTNPYITIVWDTDALAYISSVESSDGQPLEFNTRIAYNNFIKGCKSDGIWSAIKACCILAGARTLSGALVPLVGSAPTNLNFVSADYNRKTGLLGNATTKYLNSNRSADADPQNSFHMSVYVTQAASSSNVYYSGSVRTSPTPITINGISTNVGFGNRSSANVLNSGRANTGLAAHTRSSSSSYSYRWASGTYSGTASSISIAPPAQNIFIFGSNTNGSIATRSNGRLSFYSIGEAIDLAKLDTRVTTLMTDLAAAIP